MEEISMEKLVDSDVKFYVHLNGKQLLGVTALSWLAAFFLARKGYRAMKSAEVSKHG